MSDMSEPGNVVVHGSKLKTLRPYQIAAKLLRFGEQTISVEMATDEQFQAWVVSSGLLDLIDENGIAEWSFDDRCRLINHAIRLGRDLQFVEPNNSANNSTSQIVSQLFDRPHPA